MSTKEEEEILKRPSRVVVANSRTVVDKVVDNLWIKVLALSLTSPFFPPYQK
jgi:hypothetical protein